MKNQDVEKFISDFVANSPYNKVPAEKALSSEVKGLIIFDEPICSYASEDNHYLNELKNIPEANINMEPPDFWLPGAKSIVSIFFPYTSTVRKSNIKGERPSNEWLHGRIEGQALINELLRKLKSYFEENGFTAVIPTLDERFTAQMDRQTKEGEFGSNWSERHVAYAAGLGTFSLSKGLITEKGVAGRFGSLITDAELEPMRPQHKGLMDNCTLCGACVKRCPKQVISLESGKIHKPCSDYLDDILDEMPPYYGCGKCQVGVPCENKIP